MMTRKLAASAALAAMVLGMMVTPALAKGNEGKGHGPKITENFEDMKGYEWGLADVTRLNLSGVFHGRSEHLFAPGAKISHQEVAVAAVRLVGKEAEAQALSSEQVDALLTKFPDEKKLASWARPAVAELIKLNALAYDAPFGPEDDATRLYTAVLLVKAMGLEAEAQAKMNTTLPFKDAKEIPANKVGYVAVAIDHGLITGYVEEGASTFRPNQAVKRIEMAVMMGRADQQLEHKDELKGIVKSINATAGTFVMTVKGQDVTVTLSDDAAVFVNKQVKSLTEITAGMFAEVKLNAQNEAIFVDARPATSGDQTPVTQTVNGTIAGLTAATATTPAKVTLAVTVNGQTQTADYTLDATSVIKIDGQVAQLADLRTGDKVAITITNQKVTLVAVTRTVVTTANGQLTAVQVANGTTLASVTVTATVNGTSTATVYPVAANAQFLLNGQAATLATLQVGDAVTLTLTNGIATKVEATRTVVTNVTGVISGMTVAVGSTLPQLNVAVTINGVTTSAAYSIPANATILVNGQAALFTDLHLGDAVRLTLSNQVVTRAEVTR